MATFHFQISKTNLELFSEEPDLPQKISEKTTSIHFTLAFWGVDFPSLCTSNHWGPTLVCLDLFFSELFVALWWFKSLLGQPLTQDSSSRRGWERMAWTTGSEVDPKGDVRFALFPRGGLHCRGIFPINMHYLGQHWPCFHVFQNIFSWHLLHRFSFAWLFCKVYITWHRKQHGRLGNRKKKKHVQKHFFAGNNMAPESISDIMKKPGPSFPGILVGGFNPFEKYARQIGNLPQFSGWT